MDDRDSPISATGLAGENQMQPGARVSDDVGDQKLLHVCLVENKWIGHHAVFACQFTHALLRNGHHVTALCPRPDQVHDFVENRDASLLDRLNTIKLNPRPYLARGLARVCNAIGPPIRAIESELMMRWYHKKISAAELESARPFDVIFFACLYEKQFYACKRQFEQWPWPSTGLSLNSRGLRADEPDAPSWWKRVRAETWLSSAGLRGIATFDEFAERKLPEINREASIVRFPDFADVQPLDTSSPLPSLIEERRQGRPVVSLLGILVKRKGLLTLLETAHDPRNRDILFVVAGAISWPSFTRKERKTIKRLIERENVVCANRRLSDEEFNGTLSISDVIWAVYEGWTDSSNLLTKAARVRRPVLACESYCIGNRTKSYHLGETIPPADQEAATQAIAKMMKPNYLEELAPRWDALVADHDVGRLPECFQLLFAKV